MMEGGGKYPSELTNGGYTLNPTGYLRAYWSACQSRYQWEYCLCSCLQARASLEREREARTHSTEITRAARMIYAELAHTVSSNRTSP